MIPAKPLSIHRTGLTSVDLLNCLAFFIRPLYLMRRARFPFLGTGLARLLLGYKAKLSLYLLLNL